MPYRRLPNTDKARLKAMETAVDKMRRSDSYVPVIAPDLLVRVERLLWQFQSANRTYLSNLDQQLAFSRSDKYQTRLKTARMYVSHFIMVFNMCVKRKEFKVSDRSYYSMPEDMSEVPDLSTDVAVLRWCENVIRGERERTGRGGIPVYNPSVAKLAVHYDLFNELYKEHKRLKSLTDESLNAVAVMRPEADALILDVWNSIEKFFSNLSGEERLDACRSYGVIYYYRKGEKTD